MQQEIHEPSRKEIWKMFDDISPTYDRVNRVMTFGLDQHWRRKVANFLPQGIALKILDCATGTGDQILALMQKKASIASIIGIDLAEEMIAIGKEKIANQPYADKVSFQTASALELPFPDNTFDCVTIAFGIRNVTDVPKALREFFRVLKPGGRVLILEGTKPNIPLVKQCHLFYLRHCLPRIGGWISKNSTAYRYLNQTIESFPQGKAFCDLMRAEEFSSVKANPLMGGVSTVYQGDKDV